MVAQYGPADGVRCLRVSWIGSADYLALQAHVRDRLWVYRHHLDHLVVLEVAALRRSGEDARVVVPRDIFVAIDVADVVDLRVRRRTRLGRDGAIVSRSLGSIAKQPVLQGLETWLLIEGIRRVKASW